MKKLLICLMAMAFTASSLCAAPKKKGNNANYCSSGGKVLNIYSYNEEFQNVVMDNLGYEFPENVTVEWHTIPFFDGNYLNTIKDLLNNQNKLSNDEKIDLLIIEPDYIKHFINAGYLLDVKKDIGLSDEDMKNQFQYTKDIASDNKGSICGVSWMVTPSMFIYRRAIAKEVLGTDDPDEVQAYVSSWDGMDHLAEMLKGEGYELFAGIDETFRAFSQSKKTPWVVNNKINIDPALKEWVEHSRKYTDKGYNKGGVCWDYTWMDGMSGGRNIFAYYGADWFINYVMNFSAAPGEWGICMGPEASYWGGSFVCAAKGTDNADVIKDLLLKISCDEKAMKKLCGNSNTIPNNKAAVKTMDDEGYTSEFLGDQKVMQYYYRQADSLRQTAATEYDLELNNLFMTEMKEYIFGNVSISVALENFYEAAYKKFPELK